ncbi:hypothetical protein D3C73_1273130 [compost metagenome]
MLQVQLALRQGHAHHFNAHIQVVFDGAGHGFVQIHRAQDGFLVGGGSRNQIHGAVAVFGRFELLGLHRATRKQYHRQGSGSGTYPGFIFYSGPARAADAEAYDGAHVLYPCRARLRASLTESA